MQNLVKLKLEVKGVAQAYVLTFSGPLLQQRGATAAQQECALMRRCLTITSGPKQSWKIRGVYHLLFCLLCCLVQPRSLLLLQHSRQVQQSDDSPSVQRTDQLLTADERRQLQATVHLADPLQQTIWLLGRTFMNPIHRPILRWTLLIKSAK